MSGDSDVADVGVICGPTGAGKSGVALWLADHGPTTIISADSRQIYRGFDIGTAKATADELSCVPHRGIDVADAGARYSAAAWADSADLWIREAIEYGRLPLVVGGTGLYLRALLQGLFEEPALDATRRAALSRVLAGFDVAELRRWTAVLDAHRAHLGRTQLMRAVEIALLTGQRVSDLHQAHRHRARWRPRYLLVDPGAALSERIGARIDDMLDHGWPDEVWRLMETIPAHAPAWNATGYAAVRRMVMGESTRASVREEILIATRQYAKRQRTWFRHQLPPESVTRVDPTAADWRDVVARWREGLS